MTLWLTRAGSGGEYESKFLNEGRIYLTWDRLSADLALVPDKQALLDLLVEQYPDYKMGRLRNWMSQIWPFAHRMVAGDWVVLPSKLKGSIHFGEITGPYVHVPEGPDPFYHYRPVRWFATDIPRSNFDQDILYSLGAFMTICNISRNNAEERIRFMSQHAWQSQTPRTDFGEFDDTEVENGSLYDMEPIARDQIAKFLERKFKGHGMVRLIEAILEAKGYTTYRSPEGPDKGIDLLAATGPLGFGHPRICVQVKTGSTPVDHPTLDQLVGAMHNVGAEHGLLGWFQEFGGQRGARPVLQGQDLGVGRDY
ncbi:MAG: restriction endonuclease [Anaerolineales bacterium]|nr:restriction endonuclease [Anaerolineales bacterium]